jgi:hypothetical protein
MSFELENFHRNISDADLLEDLRAASGQLTQAGKRLTFRSYREFGKYSPSTINDRFGSWNIAIKEAGLLPIGEKYISTELLFDNLRNVWIAKGRQPVYRDMTAPPSQIHGSTYNDRFGGWRKALIAFVASVTQDESVLLDATDVPEIVKPATRTGRAPSLSLRFLVLKRDNFRCIACGRSPATVSGLVLEVDHKLPWSKGGETRADNLQTLCFDCNRGKMDR